MELNNQNSNNFRGIELDGQIIGGDYSAIKVRQKSGTDFEMGELVTCEFDDKKIIYKVTDLNFSSQLSDQNLELISGLNLEKEIDHQLIESDLRNYLVANLKPLVLVENNSVKERVTICKILPKFFTGVRRVVKEDLKFMSEQVNSDSVLFGKLRSGSKELDVPVYLPGKEVYSHHILITATTGKGKSNLVKNLLFNSVEKGFVANLVLDPHNEYFGATSLGLKDHKDAKDKVVFYSNNKTNTSLGVNSLRINLKLIEPNHLRGVINLSDVQWQAVHIAFNNYKQDWVKAFFDGSFYDKYVNTNLVKEDTFKVLVRIMTNLFSISDSNAGNSNDNSSSGRIKTRGIFSLDETEAISFVDDVIRFLSDSKTVIIDTSSIASKVEILIGSLLASKVFYNYRNLKMIGELDSKPIVNIVLEEAPRVLGKEALEKGSNIFDSIAREGRKFKIGLTAITQLPSLIPKTILANINSKIILGTENNAERQAIVDSAAHDLSADNRAIASLDRGEAIVSSNFSKFAIPVKIPFFDNTVKQAKLDESKNNSNIYTNRDVNQIKQNQKVVFSGMSMD